MATHMGSKIPLVENFLSDSEASADEYAKEIIALCSTDTTFNILSVVESLSPYLTAAEVEKRLKGTSLIAELMHHVASGYLNSQEIETFVIFFCERLHDHHSIQPLVIYAFLGLVSYHNVQDDDVIKILQTLFSEVHVQSLVHADRRNVFNLFSNLLHSKLNVLQRISADFVLGFIQAMDSERDPRNLLICFQNSAIVLKNLDFSLFIEDFFEVLSCYYPIDFTPPKDMDFHVSSEDLVMSLKSCLTTTSLFAEYAIPLFVEKLSSDVTSAKKDSLITFTECLKIYSPNHVELFINDIWLQIRKDFLLSEKSEISLLYSEFVSEFIKCISKSTTNDSLDVVVNFLMKDCHQTLKDPDMTIVEQCSDIIECIGCSSEYAFDRIVDGLIPPIEKSLQKYSSHTQRSNLLILAEKLLSVSLVHQKCLPILNSFVENSLSICYEVLENLSNETLFQIVLLCITDIIKLAAFLKNINFKILLEHTFHLITKQVLNEKLLQGYHFTCQAAATNLPQDFKCLFIDSIQNLITSPTIFNQCIKLLPSCITNDELRQHIFTLIITLLEKSSTTPNISVESLLDTLINILKACKDTIHQTCVFQPVLKYLFGTAANQTRHHQILTRCLSYAYQKLSFTDQGEVFRILNHVLVGDMSSLVVYLDINNNFKSEDIEYARVIFYHCVLSQIPIKLLHESATTICQQLIKFLNDAESKHTIMNEIGICLACVINKRPEAGEMVLKELQSSPSNKLSVCLLCWITKGLMLNWQTETTKECVEFLLNLLKDENTSNLVAEYFKNFVAEDEIVLTKDSGAVIKFMYKQRFTQLVLPLLIRIYDDGSEAVKACCMKVISLTLQSAPKSMLQTHLKTLTPLLMNALVTFDTEQILQATLSTLHGVLEHDQSVLQDYLSTFASRLMHLVTHEKMNIRILSLQCLTQLSTFESYVVQPLKKDVLRFIRPALDDKKRFVRKEAVKCSNAWHLMA